ncbi:MAG TPA: phosphotransferase [Planctomycetota bacterium]|nr:phosphotransferase [Planctomycetota bacterium]
MAEARRHPKEVPVPDAVREALPRLVEKHVPGHPLQAVFGLPGGGRPKFLAKLEAMEERPLLLTLYGPDEGGRIESSVAAARALAVRRAAPSFHVIAADATGATAPFAYRLATFLWGTDAGRLLESGAVDAKEAAEIGEAIGDGLGLMHAVDGVGYGPAASPALERKAALSEALLDAGAEAVQAAAGTPAAAAVEAAFEKLVVAVTTADPAIDASGEESRLVHGDLDLASAIVRKERGRYELVGLVRLDRARWLDPIYDLVCLEDALLRFPLLREPFMKAYMGRKPRFAEMDAKRPVMRALRDVMRAGAR